MKNRDFWLMLVSNVVFVFLYFAVNWAEYLSWNGQLLQTNFPWGVQYSPKANGPGILLIIQFNWTLLVFLLAMLMNIYFLFRLQRGRK